MKLANKTALVTGAAQGLGAEIARLFASEGAFVFVCDLNETQGSALVDEITQRSCLARFCTLDVTKEADWVKALTLVRETRGGLDILVNNAGINIRENIEEMKAEHLDTMLSVNVKGPFLGIKHSLPLMREHGGGSILNMSSICGLIGHRYTNEAYTTTKGAVSLLTKSVAVRYAKDNIRCNSLHPSTVDTPLVQVLFKDPARKAERIGEIPLGRLASEKDVAHAALYLVSNEAAFINGVAFPIDGGLCAY